MGDLQKKTVETTINKNNLKIQNINNESQINYASLLSLRYNLNYI